MIGDRVSLDPSGKIIRRHQDVSVFSFRRGQWSNNIDRNQLQRVPCCHTLKRGSALARGILSCCTSWTRLAPFHSIFRISGPVEPLTQSIQGLCFSQMPTKCPFVQLFQYLAPGCLRNHDLYVRTSFIFMIPVQNSILEQQLFPLLYELVKFPAFTLAETGIRYFSRNHRLKNRSNVFVSTLELSYIAERFFAGLDGTCRLWHRRKKTGREALSLEDIHSCLPFAGEIRHLHFGGTFPSDAPLRRRILGFVPAIAPVAPQAPSCCKSTVESCDLFEV